MSAARRLLLPLLAVVIVTGALAGCGGSKTPTAKTCAVLGTGTKLCGPALDAWCTKFADTADSDTQQVCEQVANDPSVSGPAQSAAGKAAEQACAGYPPGPDRNRCMAQQ